MVPAGNKAKHLSSVNHTTKTIHHHHHHHHHVNESIQYNYYFFSYWIFNSSFHFSQFNLYQTLRCVYVDSDRNFGKFLGRDKHKYGLI